MSRKLIAVVMGSWVTACVGVALLACDEATPRPGPRFVVARPVVEETPGLEAVPELKDAGAVAIAVADSGLDALALAHDTPKVDHLARARQLKLEGDAKGALTEARRALFTEPTDEETLTLTAHLARQAKQTELAAEAWGRLAALRPDDALPLVQQARVLRAAKDYPGAVMAGREAIARDAQNAETWQIVGLAQLAMNELPGAIASFEKAVEIEPGHGWALNNLGFAYLRANENEQAVSVLERAAEKLPTVAYVHNNLGVALERTGRNDEARAAYQHAMDLSPKYVKARINAARLARVGVEPEDTVEPDTMSDVPHAMPESPRPE